MVYDDKTLQTKESQGWTTDDGVVVAPHTLYRFVDENGDGGCWYAKIENAERSWVRRIGGACRDTAGANPDGASAESRR